MARKRVIKLTGATASLSKNQSGSLVVLDRDAGIVVTLPPSASGLNYEFAIKTAVTSNRYDIVTQAADKVRGALLIGVEDTASKSFVATASDEIRLNGSTTGGGKGTRFQIACDAAGVWNVRGVSESTGTEATPFA